MVMNRMRMMIITMTVMMIKMACRNLKEMVMIRVGGTRDGDEVKD